MFIADEAWETRISRVPQVDYELKTSFEKSGLSSHFTACISLYMFKETCKCWSQSLEMPKATESAQHEQHTIEYVLPEETSKQEETRSDQEQDVEQKVSISPSHTFPSMFMPFIVGPKWTGLLMIIYTTGSWNGK